MTGEYGRQISNAHQTQSKMLEPNGRQRGTCSLAVWRLDRNPTSDQQLVGSSYRDFSVAQV